MAMAAALRQPHYGPLLRGDDDISRPLLTRNGDGGATRRRRWNPLLAVTCAWWLFFLRWCAFGYGRMTAATAAEVHLIPLSTDAVTTPHGPLYLLCEAKTTINF